MTVPDRARPLFTLDDIGVDNLRRWVDESQEWIRVVGPLVSTVYLSGAPVEVSVIQVGVSIEALGHRIAVREQRITADESSTSPSTYSSLNATLDISISDVLRCDHHHGVGPFDENSEWATAFNEVYKQAKHADHPLPNLHRAAILAQSGATLLRLWLAQEFGATRRVLDVGR